MPKRDFIHSPRLGTVLMIESKIKKNKDLLTVTQLWKSLPKKVMYQTFKQVISYLEASNKITIKNRKIIWIALDNPKLEEIIKKSKTV